MDYQVAGNARAGAELTRDADIIEFPYVSDKKKKNDEPGRRFGCLVGCAVMRSQSFVIRNVL